MAAQMRNHRLLLAQNRQARTRRSPDRPSRSRSVIGATEAAPGRRRHSLTASCTHTASDVFVILIAGQVAVHLPGARSGPADRCRMCPELLLCVRLLKLRPRIRRRSDGTACEPPTESGRYLCVRLGEARRGTPRPAAALRILRACSRRLECSGFHRLPVHGAPASHGPRAHELVPVRVGPSCRSLPVTDTGRSSGLRRRLGPSMPPVAELPV